MGHLSELFRTVWNVECLKHVSVYKMKCLVSVSRVSKMERLGLISVLSFEFLGLVTQRLVDIPGHNVTKLRLAVTGC